MQLKGQTLEVSGQLALVHTRGGKIITSRDCGERRWLVFLRGLWARGFERLRLFREHNLVTTAGVTYMAQDFNANEAAADVSLFNYHEFGTDDTPAPAIGDVALQLTCGEAREVGAQTRPGAVNVYRSTATHTFAGPFTIVEWGLFSGAAGPTLWDRRIFAAIGVVALDGITAQYSVTITPGGS